MMPVDLTRIKLNSTGRDFSVGADVAIRNIHSDGKDELGVLTNSLYNFYERHRLNFDVEPRMKENPCSATGQSYVHKVMSANNNRIAEVEIVPSKGRYQNTKSRDADYAESVTMRFFEGFLINFWPKNTDKRKGHRDAYVNFVYQK